MRPGSVFTFRDEKPCDVAYTVKITGLKLPPRRRREPARVSGVGNELGIGDNEPMGISRRNAIAVMVGAPALLLPRKSVAQNGAPEIQKGPFDGDRKSTR